MYTRIKTKAYRDINRWLSAERLDQAEVVKDLEDIVDILESASGEEISPKIDALVLIEKAVLRRVPLSTKLNAIKKKLIKEVQESKAEPSASFKEWSHQGDEASELEEYLAKRSLLSQLGLASLNKESDELIEASVSKVIKSNLSNDKKIRVLTGVTELPDLKFNINRHASSTVLLDVIKNRFKKLNDTEVNREERLKLQGIYQSLLAPPYKAFNQNEISITAVQTVLDNNDLLRKPENRELLNSWLADLTRAIERGNYDYSWSGDGKNSHTLNYHYSDIYRFHTAIAVLSRDISEFKEQYQKSVNFIRYSNPDSNVLRLYQGVVLSSSHYLENVFLNERFELSAVIKFLDALKYNSAKYIQTIDKHILELRENLSAEDELKAAQIIYESLSMRLNRTPKDIDKLLTSAIAHIEEAVRKSSQDITFDPAHKEKLLQTADELRLSILRATIQLPSEIPREDRLKKLIVFNKNPEEIWSLKLDFLLTLATQGKTDQELMKEILLYLNGEDGARKVSQILIDLAQAKPNSLSENNQYKIIQNIIPQFADSPNYIQLKYFIEGAIIENAIDVLSANQYDDQVLKGCLEMIHKTNLNDLDAESHAGLVDALIRQNIFSAVKMDMYKLAMKLGGKLSPFHLSHFLLGQNNFSDSIKAANAIEISRLSDAEKKALKNNLAVILSKTNDEQLKVAVYPIQYKIFSDEWDRTDDSFVRLKEIVNFYEGIQNNNNPSLAEIKENLKKAILRQTQVYVTNPHYYFNEGQLHQLHDIIKTHPEIEFKESKNNSVIWEAIKATLDKPTLELFRLWNGLPDGRLADMLPHIKAYYQKVANENNDANADELRELQAIYQGLLIRLPNAETFPEDERDLVLNNLKFLKKPENTALLTAWLKKLKSAAEEYTISILTLKENSATNSLANLYISFRNKIQSKEAKDKDFSEIYRSLESRKRNYLPHELSMLLSMIEYMPQTNLNDSKKYFSLIENYVKPIPNVLSAEDELRASRAIYESLHFRGFKQATIAETDATIIRAKAHAEEAKKKALIDINLNKEAQDQLIEEANQWIADLNQLRLGKEFDAINDMIDGSGNDAKQLNLAYQKLSAIENNPLCNKNELQQFYRKLGTAFLELHLEKPALDCFRKAYVLDEKQIGELSVLRRFSHVQISKAIHVFEKTLAKANEGDVVATFNLAKFYQEGHGTKIDHLKAVENYSKCFKKLGMAAQGDVVERLKLIRESSPDDSAKQAAAILLSEIKSPKKRRFGF